ncbi:MAG: hypothetical protein ACT4PT_12515 [Methanobacteriota archaeon]
MFGFDPFHRGGPLVPKPGDAVFLFPREADGREVEPEEVDALLVSFCDDGESEVVRLEDTFGQSGWMLQRGEERIGIDLPTDGSFAPTGFLVHGKAQGLLADFAKHALESELSPWRGTEPKRLS